MNELNEKYNRFMYNLDAAGRRRLYLKLAKMMENGVAIIDALVSLHTRRIEAGQAKQPMTIALASWIKRMQNGDKLWQAMKGWIDSDEQMLIMAGEQSGRLEQALLSAAEIMMAKKHIRSAVIGGLAYPFFLLMLAFGLLVMFSFKLIPQFSQVVPDEKWTGIARMVIDFSTFIRDWLPALGVLGIAAILLFIWSLPRWSEGLRVKFDQYLPYSVYRVLVGSTWMISLSALVNAGVRTESALLQLEANSTPWLKARISACLRNLRSGLLLGDALHKSGYKFPDAEIVDDLGVYSKLSGVEVALTQLGKEWITESVERIQTMMRAVFGIAILLVAALMVFEVGGLIGMQLQMASIMQGTYQ